ncbi:MAG: hypothetical protein AAFR13_03985 [Pseudomonadota bacterium]
MAASTEFYLVAVLHFALTFALCSVGIFVFWHLQRIRKPGMARVFWFLAFGYTSVVLWRVIAAAIVAPTLFRFGLGLISVGILAAYAAAWFANPFAPKRYAYEDEGEDDEDGDFTDPNHGSDRA